MSKSRLVYDIKYVLTQTKAAHGPTGAASEGKWAAGPWSSAGPRGFLRRYVHAAATGWWKDTVSPKNKPVGTFCLQEWWRYYSLTLRTFTKTLVSHGDFTGGPERERLPEGAVHRANRLRCPGEGRGRAQTGSSWGRDTSTNWQFEGDLWTTRRGDEETGREGLSLPNTPSSRINVIHCNSL